MLNEILLLHHTHTDIGYTHEQPVVWELNRQFIDDALEQIELTSTWDQPSRPIWTCEVTETLRYWLRYATPQQVERFRSAVAAGRMSACAMPYNFTPMVGVAQFVRTLAVLPELREQIGLSLKVAMNHDINGLPWTMIPLLLDAGVEMVMMGINVHFGGFPLHRPLFFRWAGPDGRSILALNGEHYGMFQRYARLDEGSLTAMAEGIAAYEHKLASQHYPHDFAYLSLTHFAFWDNNPPYPAAFELIRRWNAEGRTPHIRFVSPEDLLERARSLDLPSYAGDWSDYWNFGAGSSAHENRLAHRARSMLAAADLLALQRHAPRDQAVPQLTDKAYTALTLWDEHTWGGWASISRPDADAVLSGWQHKAFPAYQARALAGYVLTEQLEALAGNPRHAAHADGLLIYNPTPYARSECVRVPRSLLEGRYQHLSSTLHRLALDSEEQQALEADCYGPVSVAAYGYRMLPLTELRPAVFEGLRAEQGLLESPYHRLLFEPGSGAITALIDKRSGRELVNAQSSWPFLGLVHESVDGPTDTANYGREPLLALDYGQFQETSFIADWPARRVTEQLESLHILSEPQRVGLELRTSLPGAPQITRRIWLHADRAVIMIDLSINKADLRTPDSIYLALPLNLPGWEASYDTMGTPTALDHEQLPGSCRDWLTVSGYVDVHTADAGVTLACPDSPLVMPGGFNFGKRQLHVERTGPPLLLAWLCNNYWNTNFRATQPGPLRFHYELASHNGYTAQAAAQIAACARSPLWLHPQCVARSEAGTLLEITGEGVVLAAAERTSSDVQLWLQNLTETACPAMVRLGECSVTVELAARGLQRVVLAAPHR